MALFDSSPLIQNSRFNNFLWVCWFLCKNISNFVSPVWKLHNPYCHTVLIYIYCAFFNLPDWSHSTNISKNRMLQVAKFSTRLCKFVIYFVTQRCPIFNDTCMWRWHLTIQRDSTKETDKKLCKGAFTYDVRFLGR